VPSNLDRYERIAPLYDLLDLPFEYSRYRKIRPLLFQNGYCERAIGSIRRDCLDHVIVLGERHLLHLLRCYASYYNRSRTHLSLNKDAPMRRPVHALGSIEARPVLGGLHHHYVRILISDRDRTNAVTDPRSASDRCCR
jgi:hypothetical protein